MRYGAVMLASVLALACGPGPVSAASDGSEGGGTTSGAAAESSASVTTSGTSTSADVSTSSRTGTAETDTMVPDPVPDLGPSACAVEWLPPVCWGITCEEFGCGAPSSRLDADGCARPECLSDADCTTDRHCNPRFVAAPCFQSLSCSDDDGTCSCGGNTGCNLDVRGFCLDRREFPPDAICAALEVPCDELLSWISQTAASVAEVGDALPPTLAQRVSACQGVRVDRALAACGFSPCEVLCGVTGSLCSPEDCDATCAAADPDDVLAYARLIATSPSVCGDCSACEATGNPLCATMGC